MSFSVDVNILIYAINRDAPHHRRARIFIESLASKPDTWAFPWPIAHSFIRITTHPSILPHPLSARQAVDAIEQFVQLPSVSMVNEISGFWERYKRDITSLHLKGNMIPDALLVNILKAHGITTLYSRDRDFLKFKGIKAIDPFDE